MLEENLVLALLQASITGAGLVLAVYALIVPLWRRISRHWANIEYRMYDSFRKKVADAEQPSLDQTSTLKTMLESIEMYQSLPVFFSLSIAATFTSFTISTFLSLWWVLDWNRDIMDGWLIFVFGLSTLLFLGIGLASIVLVTKALNREAEEFKQKIREGKSSAKREKNK